MRYLSLFTGIGGFEKAIERAYENITNQHERTDILQGHSGNTEGWREQELPACVGYSEIDRYAIQTYQRHYPNHKKYGDITKIDERELPDFDLLVGGFPCQSFSIAGKRRGFDDTRGTLFFDIARILREKQPRLLVLENVKGLLSHDGGNTFKTIVATLTELRYDLQWQVVNSKNHGVPQNRERVLIVGHLRGTPRPEVFPFGEAAGTTDEGPQSGNTKSEIASTIRSRYGNGTGSHLVENAYKSRKPREYFENAPTVKNYGAGGGLTPIVMPQIRRLTPIECERLQGFPDDWTKYGITKPFSGFSENETPETEVLISDTQRYKMCGNAVTVNVIQTVMEKILW